MLGPLCASLLSKNMVEDFYNALAPFYHLIYPDWEQSIEKQAEVLDNLIQRFSGTNGKSVLDLACGIGTQSLGLSQLGYEVCASDISSTAVDRATHEAKKRGYNIEFGVCDMRQASTYWNRQFDVVLACDNTLPHLLSDEEIVTALKQCYTCTKPGGISMISIRDYEADMEAGQIKYYPVREENQAHYIIFQVWKVEGMLYETSLYIVEDRRGEEPNTIVLRTQYYRIGLSRFQELMREAGYEEAVLLPEPYFQPIFIGRRGA